MYGRVCAPVDDHSRVQVGDDATTGFHKEERHKCVNQAEETARHHLETEAGRMRQMLRVRLPDRFGVFGE